jgi:hypothetical protein
VQGKITLHEAFSKSFFRLFCSLVLADADALFAVLHPPPKAIGELVFGDNAVRMVVPGLVSVKNDAEVQATASVQDFKRQ